MSDIPTLPDLATMVAAYDQMNHFGRSNGMALAVSQAGQVEYRVSGTGYSPEGKFFANESAVDVSQTPDLQLLLTVAARCNNAKVVPAKDKQDAWQVLGDPTEGALIVAARKGGVTESSPAAAELVSQIPFDSQRKAMSAIYREADGSLVMVSTGSPIQELNGRPLQYQRER